jgi:hypothetical protein
MMENEEKDGERAKSRCWKIEKRKLWWGGEIMKGERRGNKIGKQYRRTVDNKESRSN